MKTIQGPFEVKSTPLATNDVLKKMGAVSMMFEKEFHGALEGKSVVSMSGIMNKEFGSGGYVALELVEGTIEGKSGSFILQHSSLMNRGKDEQKIVVVPDSGSKELSGLEGEMKIEIKEGGKHFYTFTYRF